MFEKKKKIIVSLGLLAMLHAKFFVLNKLLSLEINV